MRRGPIPFKVSSLLCSSLYNFREYHVSASQIRECLIRWRKPHTCLFSRFLSMKAKEKIISTFNMAFSVYKLIIKTFKTILHAPYLLSISFFIKKK